MVDLNIIIADDHPMVRAALRQTLSGAMADAVISESSTFDELTALLGNVDGPFDLILLDLDMPGMQGLVGLLTVQANWPTVPVVVVSGSEDHATVARVRECGASGFIPKSAQMDKVVAAVRSVLDGGIWFDGGDGITTPPVEPGEEIARRLSTLTPQQMRVLHAILAGKLNKQIAGELDLAEQTVKGHVSQILRKLDVYSRTQVVIAVGPLLGSAAPQVV
jgi:DNA-binding NarL/FixJ family response regulator